jgi:DNA-binding SARP family transcriptional activator
VPQDTLIEALWDGAPPPAAVSAFQSKVSRLRRLLAPGELRSTPAGYLLELDDRAFDVAVFDDLARGVGDLPVNVVDRCARGLALWRGAAFEIAAGDPLVEPEARRLELLRLRTIERKLGALAALGRHDAVLAECLPLIAEDPFAEPAWEARLTALAAIGRRIDALRAFEEYRRVLADQTGLVPSARLQALARQVLEDRLPPPPPPLSPVIATGPEVVGGGAAVPTPRRTWSGEVRPNGPMVGRSPLVTAVRGWIEAAGQGRPQSVVVLGNAGTGKTSVVHELARRARAAGMAARTLRSRSPGQPLFLPFAEGPTTAAGPRAMLATARNIAGRLVDEAVDSGGLVVALDDLHLADAGTIEVAATTAEMIGEHGGGLPLLLLITSAPVAPGCRLDRRYDRLAASRTTASGCSVRSTRPASTSWCARAPGSSPPRC